MSRKGKAKINPDDLAPKIAAGLTQGASAEEALAEFPVQAPGRGGVDIVKHMRDADARTFARDGLPWAPFVAADDLGAVWRDGQTDRLQRDIHKTYTEHGMRLLREGRQCLRCDEPHPTPFPDLCDLCGYPMAERQIMDIAMEFEGTKHLGPGRPISEYMAEQEERMEKRKFIRKVLDGGQGKIPQAWLRDATLLDGLTSDDREALIGSVR